MVSNGYILLAGGDAPRRQALRRVYSPRYGILEADDGRTALDLLTGEAPGLRGAFLGLDTPGLDGCGVLAGPGPARPGPAAAGVYPGQRGGAALLDRCWKLGAAISSGTGGGAGRSRTETVLALSRPAPRPPGGGQWGGILAPRGRHGGSGPSARPWKPGMRSPAAMCAGGGRRRGTPAHPGSPMSGVWPD